MNIERDLIRTYLILTIVALAVALVGCEGKKGDVGAPGSDANLVTPIQLCPGVTTYPSAFIEVAVCIDDQLYGVYSSLDGFLTKLPPGAYVSNAIGSNCNFTVLEHCVIQ